MIKLGNSSSQRSLKQRSSKFMKMNLPGLVKTDRKKDEGLNSLDL